MRFKSIFVGRGCCAAWNQADFPAREIGSNHPNEGSEAVFSAVPGTPLDPAKRPVSLASSDPPGARGR